jgi:hypothetical protein
MPPEDSTPKNTLLRGLKQRVEHTKSVYEDAKRAHDSALERMRDLGTTHPDGSIRHATEIYTFTLREYRRALRDFNGLMLRGEAPPLNRETDLMDMLALAISVSGADMGNIQLLDESGTLRIAAQIGFEQPFLQFFSRVHAGEAACGAALKAAQRVIVEDVESSPIFSPDGCAAMLEAGARAVQSTPIVTPDGEIRGMLSTHYRSPAKVSSHNLGPIDGIARLLGIS